MESSGDAARSRHSTAYFAPPAIDHTRGNHSLVVIFCVVFFHVFCFFSADGHGIEDDICDRSRDIDGNINLIPVTR